MAYSATVLVNDVRSVRSSGDVGSQTSYQSWTSEEWSPGNFGIFNFSIDESRTAGTNESAAAASMTSSVTETLFSANAITSGSVVFLEPAGCSLPDAEGNAFFEVTFQVLTPTLFDLTGNLSFTQNSGSASGSAFLTLFDGTESSGNFNIFLGEDSASGSFSQSIQLSGLLQPDTYTLRAQASVDAYGFLLGLPESGTAAFDFNFLLDAAVVPVPAAVWLFGSAIGLLGWVGRRRSRS